MMTRDDVIGIVGNAATKVMERYCLDGMTVKVTMEGTGFAVMLMKEDRTVRYDASFEDFDDFIGPAKLMVIIDDLAVKVHKSPRFEDLR